MSASKESDRRLFEDADFHLSRVDMDLKDLLDAHMQQTAINVIGLVANAQRELRLARKYLGVELT